MLERFVNVAYRLLEVVLISLLARDDLFPVPLVDKHGMNVVSVLVAADGVHVGVKSLVDAVVVSFECNSFPFCKRMDDLKLGVRGEQIEADGSLGAVEVIVQAAVGCDEQGGGNAGQIELDRKILLKEILDFFDGDLGLTLGQQRAVARRNDGT